MMVKKCKKTKTTAGGIKKATMIRSKREKHQRGLTNKR